MRYANAKVSDLDDKTISIIRKIFDNDKKIFIKGVFLYGNTGSGKTHALHAIRNMYQKTTDLRTNEVENWVSLLTEIRGLFNSKISVLDFLNNNFYSKDCIFIDDVGSENQTDWSQEILYLIIDKAYVKEIPIFIATNLSGEEFAKKYGDRISSRLIEMCEKCSLINEDNRVK